MLICNYCVNIVGNNSEEKEKLKWVVRPIKDKVKRELVALEFAKPDSYQDMMNYLSAKPFSPMTNIAFKMKHIDVFEYKLRNRNRVCYIINRNVRLVVIYYAGKHPKFLPSVTSYQTLLMEQITREVEQFRREEREDDHHIHDPTEYKHKRRK